MNMLNHAVTYAATNNDLNKCCVIGACHTGKRRVAGIALTNANHYY